MIAGFDGLLRGKRIQPCIMSRHLYDLPPHVRLVIIKLIAPDCVVRVPVDQLNIKPSDILGGTCRVIPLVIRPDDQRNIRLHIVLGIGGIQKLLHFRSGRTLDIKAVLCTEGHDGRRRVLAVDAIHLVV